MQEVVSGVSKDVEEERFIQMAEFLRARAPKLAPNVAPGGHLKLAASNLMTICRTHKQRLEAESDIARRIKANNDSEVDEVGDREDKEVVLDTELDFRNRTFRIRGAKLAGKTEATLRNLGRLMELHLNSSPAELEPYAEAFASANGMAEDVSAMTTLRDVCSLAYALHIAASHMPGWKAYVGSRQLPIAEDADVTELLDELFGPAPSSSSASGSTAKSNRKKGKPGKRPKSRSKSTEPRKMEETGKEAGKNGAGKLRTRQGKGASGDNVAKPARAKSPQPAEVSGKDGPAQGERSPKGRKAVAKKQKQETKPSSTRPKGSKRKAK